MKFFKSFMCVLCIIALYACQKHKNNYIPSQMGNDSIELNNQKLNRSYLETIAGQWKRLNIETVEEAMRLTEKEYKKMKKIAMSTNTNKNSKVASKQKEILPDWFNEDLKTNSMDSKEKEEMDTLLSSF